MKNIIFRIIRNLNIFINITVIINITSCCSQTNNNQGESGSEAYQRQLLEYDEAKAFFLSTLKANFEKTDEENLYTLFKYLSKENSVGEFFRLQINTKEFSKLNNSLKTSYCRYFPITEYEYDMSYDNISIDFTDSKDVLCDTIIYKVPVKVDCLPFYDGPLTVYLAESFKESIDLNGGILEKAVTKNFTFSPNIQIRYLIDEMSKTPHDLKQSIDSILNQKSSSSLLTILMWKYLAHCANYNLETRKFIYER